MAKNFCIYCGTPLTPGVECACRAGAAPVPETPAYEAYTEPVPAYSEPAPAYAEPAPVYAEPAPVAPVSSSAAPAKFCIYCGTPITPGVECACRSGVATAPETPAYEAYTEPVPAYSEPAPAYAEPAPVYAEPAPVAPVSSSTAPAKFCTRCGRPLVPGEICNCVGGAGIPSYEVPNPGAVSGGIKTTMRTSDKPSKAPSAPNPFLSKPSDLD